MPKAMDDVVTSRRSWKDYVTPFKFSPKKWHKVRLYGLVTTDFRHNVPTLTGKSYPEYCHAWDVDVDSFMADRNARCEACARDVPGSYRYFMNLIDLEQEEEKPAKPKPDWSCIYYCEISKTLFEKLQGLRQLNKGYTVSHPVHGANVMIVYDPDKSASDMYNCNLDEKDVALTPDQISYTVTQSYEDGSKKLIRGDEKIPAQFSYVRVANTRALMVSGLDRNKVGPQFKKLASLEEMGDNESEEKLVSKASAEMKVQQAPETLKKRAPVEEVDDTPPPKKAAPADDVDQSALAHPECPTAYGEFANATLCFTKCKARTPCRAMSKAVKSSKKAEADDDDTV